MHIKKTQKYRAVLQQQQNHRQNHNFQVFKQDASRWTKQSTGNIHKMIKHEMKYMYTGYKCRHYNGLKPTTTGTPTITGTTDVQLL